MERLAKNWTKIKEKNKEIAIFWYGEDRRALAFSLRRPLHLRRSGRAYVEYVADMKVADTLWISTDPLLASTDSQWTSTDSLLTSSDFLPTSTDFYWFLLILHWLLLTLFWFLLTIYWLSTDSLLTSIVSYLTLQWLLLTIYWLSADSISSLEHSKL